MDKLPQSMELRKSAGAMMSPELRESHERMSRIPVYSLAEFCTLDPDEIREGYQAAHEGLGCGDNMSRAYWHGWTVCQINEKKMETPDAHRALIHEIFVRFGGLSTEYIEYHRKQFAWLKSMGLA